MHLWSWTRRRVGGLSIGLFFTGLGGLCLSLGWLRGLDNRGLDLHFRWFSTIPADPRILLVDIDDASIAAVGEWPWKRRRHAQLVEVLDSLGARRIVLDVVFSDATPPRVEPAGLGPNYDVDPPAEVLGEAGSDRPIFDDDELRRAIAAAGNVYLAMFARLAPPEGHRVSRDPTEAVPPEKQAAVEFLVNHPAGSWPAFFRERMPGERLDAVSPQRQALLSAFRWAKGRAAVMERCAKASDGVRAHLQRAFDLTPPLEKLTRAAKGVGLVAFHRKRTRGVVRELPMLARTREAILPHLGFAVAMDVMGVTPEGAAVDGRCVVLRADAKRVAVPIDDEGLTLVNWHVPGGGDWRDSFTHIPATRLLEIADLRTAIDENVRRYEMTLGELVRLRCEGLPAAFEAYARLVNQRRALRPDLAAGDERPASAEAVERLAAINEEIRAIEAEAMVWLKHAWGLWEAETPQDQQERQHRDRLRRLFEQFGDGRLAREVEELNGRLAAKADAAVERLLPQVRGKISIVAHTATAVGDLVTSPVYDLVPGVMAHANVINTFLQGRAPVRAGLAWNLLLLVVGGVMMTLLGNVGGWRAGLAALVAVSFGVVVLGVVTFLLETVHLATLPAVLTVACTWAGVTVYRQSTEERTRRRLLRALTQYTSPAIASRIADRIQPDDLDPQSATVTCFFSDLAAFTGLSEALGPRTTRAVLNPYLRAVSGVLIERGAIVNKFLGDGVFAFFNAPIRPCREHSREACLAALRTVEALNSLNASLARHSGSPTEPRIGSADGRAAGDSPGAAGQGLLRVRIGITTGDAFVGDYGSEAKLDYTCIGDTVNVASRLERANKVLGTRILVDEATRRGCGAEFRFRSLGRLALPGKHGCVEACELLGTADDADPSAAAFVEAFGHAVGHYQRCEWAACLDALAKCRRIRPEDPAVQLYDEAARIFAVHPPPTDWAGTVVIGTS